MNYYTLSNIAVEDSMVGSTVEEKFYSKTLDKNWKYMAYYPAMYSKEKKYPVIYLLHGAYGTHRDYKDFGEVSVLLDRAIVSEKLPPCIVIIPDGMDAWYTDTKNIKMQSAFENDLFPYVEKNFNVINKKYSRVIGGLSMGGLGSLIFALRNPSYFNFCFIMSPITTELGDKPPSIHILERNFKHIFGKPFSQEKWDEHSYHKHFKEYLLQEQRLNFLIINGKDDNLTTIENARKLSNNLKSNGVEHAYIEVPSASHSWGFWNMALGVCFEHAGKFLLKS